VEQLPHVVCCFVTRSQHQTNAKAFPQPLSTDVSR
jgi:hypothetical protein